MSPAIQLDTFNLALANRIMLRGIAAKSYVTKQHKALLILT